VNADPDDRRSRHRLAIAAVLALVMVGAVLGGFVGLVGSALVSVLPDAEPQSTRSVRQPKTYEPLTPHSPTQPTETAQTESPRPPQVEPTLTATSAPGQANTFVAPRERAFIAMYAPP